MSNKPWEEKGVPWKTEEQFLNWVKGAIRKGWSRHPVRILKLKAVRVRAPLGRKTQKNPTGLVWCVKCEICGEIIRQSKAEVDHKHKMKEEKWYHNIEAFVIRMYWVGFNDLQVLCKPCHYIKSLSDLKNCSFEEARDIHKPIIAFRNKKAKEQVDTLKQIGIIPGKNQEIRVEQYKEWLTD